MTADTSLARRDRVEQSDEPEHGNTAPGRTLMRNSTQVSPTAGSQPHAAEPAGAGIPRRHDVVADLRQQLSEGCESLFGTAPVLLKSILSHRDWASRRDKRGQPFESFEAFVTYPLWWGLESTIDDLLYFCRKYPEVQQLIRAEVEPERGRRLTGATP